MNVLVNPTKKQRAEEIVALLSRASKNTEEQTLKDKFGALIADDKVKETDRVEYVYEKLGGLIRTEVEHKAAEKKEKETLEKFEKNKK